MLILLEGEGICWWWWWGGCVGFFLRASYQFVIISFIRNSNLQFEINHHWALAKLISCVLSAVTFRIGTFALNDFYSDSKTGVCPGRIQIYQVISYRHEMRNQGSRYPSFQINKVCFG